MWQFFLNSSHAHSQYAFNILTFISWFIIASIAIFTMSNEWVFSLSVTFLSQIILRIFRFSWSLALFFISFLMTFFWLFMLIVVCISCVSIAKIRRDMRVKFAISFAHSWVFFRFACASELTAWRKMSLLFSLQRDMIRFHWLIDMSAILWRICSMIFFCIFSLSSLSAIFIMILHFLQSNDDLSLRRCSVVDNSSLVMFAYNMIFNERCIFLCICNCLLSSWTYVFSFCTFFAMNAFWVVWCFSSDSSQRRCISFTATSFHEWSLLFSFSNVDVCIKRSIMLVTYFLSLHKLFDLTLLFLRDKSTSLAIVFESALLQFMQFIVVYSSFRFILSWLYCSFQKFALRVLWLFFKFNKANA